jgi:hypothetical protein
MLSHKDTLHAKWTLASSSRSSKLSNSKGLVDRRPRGSRYGACVATEEIQGDPGNAIQSSRARRIGCWLSFGSGRRRLPGFAVGRPSSSGERCTSFGHPTKLDCRSSNRAPRDGEHVEDGSDPSADESRAGCKARRTGCNINGTQCSAGASTHSRQREESGTTPNS